jgi:flagella basal body P-ring formation protein FlgA
MSATATVLLVLTMLGEAAPAATVLARPLGRGAALTSADLLPERDGSPAEVPEAFLGLVARRHLSPGTTLQVQDFRSPPAVLRNQEVTVVARRGALVVTMKGRAAADGEIGSAIAVVNRATAKRVGGIVVAPGVVEVAF